MHFAVRQVSSSLWNSARSSDAVDQSWSDSAAKEPGVDRRRYARASWHQQARLPDSAQGAALPFSDLVRFECLKRGRVQRALLNSSPKMMDSVNYRLHMIRSLSLAEFEAGYEKLTDVRIQCEC